MSTREDALREEVREKYAEAARRADSGATCGCGSTCCTDGNRDEGCCGDECCAGGSPGDFGQALYSDEERSDLPEGAARASLGCGTPAAVAELHEGETVLDLGSGGGIDMTDEMLALAQRNAQTARVKNAIFLKGEIENVPLPAASVDVVISNCVINLSTDKTSVLIEMARVLRPGGRIGVSDVVADDRLSPEERAERGSYVGCIAGALSKGEYEAGLEEAGFTDISVSFTHEVADGMHAAVVKATKPTGGTTPLPLVAAESGCC
jgi:SAM-dependent methyltransferase